MKRKWLVATAIFVVAFAIRLPFRSLWAYHWDSVAFAQAITDYDLSRAQPHPPGYFLYVMIGRLVNCVVGDPHASLVGVSLVCGSGLVAVMYLLGTAMCGQRCGAVAAALAMTSPMTWFYSGVALTYSVDSFLVSVFVLWAWLARRRGGTWNDVIGMGVLLSAIAGVRQQTVPGLLPLVMFVFAKFRPPRLGKALLGMVVALLACTAWALPMITMTGGWTAYWQVFHHHAAFNALRTFGGAGFDALVWNVFFLGLFCTNGLMLGVVPLAVGMVYRTLRREVALNFVLIWVAPMILIATWLSFIVLPGHVMSFLPGLILGVAIVVAQLHRVWTMTVLLVSVNVFAFVAWPAGWDRVFHGTGLTARALREHDRQLAQAVEVIRSRYKPDDTAVVHAAAWLPLGFRHFMYYLPEFDHYQLAEDRAIGTPPDKPTVSAKSGKILFVRHMDLAGKRNLLLIVPPGQSLKIFDPFLAGAPACEVTGSGGQIYELSAAGLTAGTNGTIHVIDAEQVRR